MNRKLNHSRHMDIYAKDIGDGAYHSAKRTPTSKQVKFYKKLYAMCKEHNVDSDVGFWAKTRVDYARAIDILLERLLDKGVDVKGNGKKFDRVIEVKEDRRRREIVTEKLRVVGPDVEDTEEVLGDE